jgi:hypothetical protein
MKTLKRTAHGYQTVDGRYLVEYRKPASGPWTWAWCAVDVRTGREVPCRYQSEARARVLTWLAGELGA